MGVSSSFQWGIGDDGKTMVKVDFGGDPGKKMKLHHEEGNWKMTCVARKSLRIHRDK